MDLSPTDWDAVTVEELLRLHGALWGADESVEGILDHAGTRELSSQRIAVTRDIYPSEAAQLGACSTSQGLVFCTWGSATPWAFVAAHKGGEPVAVLRRLDESSQPPSSAPVPEPPPTAPGAQPAPVAFEQATGLTAADLDEEWEQDVAGPLPDGSDEA